MSEAAIGRIAADAGLPKEILQQALEWLVIVWSREATTEQLKHLAQWREADPDHEHAWRYVQQLDDKLQSVPASVGASSLRAADRTSTRRRFLLSLGVVGAAGGAALALRDATLFPSYFADVRTATGEVRALKLADGTRLTVNTASALNIGFTDDERRLRLVEGEILVATAVDTISPPRPFLVETAEGSVRPVGTRFIVRHTGTRAEVTVLEGAVQVRPRRANTVPTDLGAGDRVRFTAFDVEHTGAAFGAGAWADGLIIAEQMRLADLLAELDRYRPGMIRCRADVAALSVSGTFPATDTDRALAALAEALPVRVTTFTPYLVTVAAAEKNSANP